ncbi:ankyrin repeat domain-containing protein [Legionella bozemanae]|uniref:ankyrin repeat domain-containing protein n=1 Tax=Legionella bozemanae TaxID=447 RepID=UPI0010415775|nr:ankyrin repeat domain-containing protein [Legionella bozemanae]
MASIIELMAELNFPTNQGGVCVGLALMAERARRCGQYEKFKERMDYLENLGSNQLASLLVAAKKHAALLSSKPLNKPLSREEEILSKTLLTKDEEILLTIEAFFFQVWMHYKPDEIQSFLELNGEKFHQKDTQKLESFMYDIASSDKEISPLNEPKKFFLSDTTLNNAPSLQQFLEKIQSASQKEQLSFGIVMDSGTHAIHVFYNNQTNTWTLTNHSDLRTCDSIQTTARRIAKAFTENEIFHLSLSVFTDEPAEKLSGFWKELEAVSTASFLSIIENKNVNATDSFNNTPLLVAAMRGHKEVVQELLKQPETNVNKANNLLDTPLLYAACLGYPEIVAVLMNHPQIAPEKSYLCSPLFAAVANGHLEVVQELLKHPSKINVNQDGTLALAVKIGRKDIFHELLKSPFIDTNTYKSNALFGGNERKTALIFAIERGDFDIVDELLNHNKIDISRPGNFDDTPLKSAICSGHLNIVKELCKNENLDVNFSHSPGLIRRNTALILAINYNRIDMIQELLKHPKIDVNEKGELELPLHQAIKDGKIDVVKELLKHPKIDLLKVDKSGRNSLVIAIERGDAAIISALREKFSEIGNQAKTKDSSTFSQIESSMEPSVFAASSNSTIPQINPSLSFFTAAVPSHAAAPQDNPSLRFFVPAVPNNSTVPQIAPPNSSDPAVKNSYTMEPIINFIKITIERLHTCETRLGKTVYVGATYLTWEFEQYLQSVEREVNGDILEPETLGSLKPLVNKVRNCKDLTPIFVQERWRFFPEFTLAMKEMERRYKAITVDSPTCANPIG